MDHFKVTPAWDHALTERTLLSLTDQAKNAESAAQIFVASKCFGLCSLMLRRDALPQFGDEYHRQLGIAYSALEQAAYIEDEGNVFVWITAILDQMQSNLVDENAED